MAKRVKLNEKVILPAVKSAGMRGAAKQALEAHKSMLPVKKPGGKYFTESLPIKFFSSGCTTLDCVISGGKGWPLGRMSNIVGDKAVGKSLLAIEACANFARAYKNGRIFYRESEAAFDIPYANNLGLPEDRVDFGPEGIESQWDTIEDVFEDLDAQLDACLKAEVPGLYIIDSLDALSSRAEMARKPGEASFGGEKPKILGELFRKLTRRIKKADFAVIIVSQIRDNIGAMFGEKHKRAGGKSMDFYASAVIWLTHLKINNLTRGGATRAVSVNIKAKCKKNKIVNPFRECQFTISFGYGVEDIASSLDWLEENKMLDKLLPVLGLKSKNEIDPYFDTAQDTPEGYLAANKLLRGVVIDSWEEVEARFRPTRKKYG